MKDRGIFGGIFSMAYCGMASLLGKLDNNAKKE